MYSKIGKRDFQNYAIIEKICIVHLERAKYFNEDENT